MPASPAQVTVTVDDVSVLIKRSGRRTRSMSARFEDGGITVLAPAHLSARAEMAMVTDLVRKVMRKRGSARNDDALMRRALQLTREYIPSSPEPSSVRWVGNMTTRWASCSPRDGSIRLSDKLVGMPQYVIDAVLIHELAHLVEHGHGPEFQAIVTRFEHHDRADAYLEGASFGARRPGELPTAPLDSDEPIPAESADRQPP